MCRGFTYVLLAWDKASWTKQVGRVHTYTGGKYVDVVPTGPPILPPPTQDWPIKKIVNISKKKSKQHNCDFIEKKVGVLYCKFNAQIRGVLIVYFWSSKAHFICVAFVYTISISICEQIIETPFYEIRTL